MCGEVISESRPGCVVNVVTSESRPGCVVKL